MIKTHSNFFCRIVTTLFAVLLTAGCFPIGSFNVNASDVRIDGVNYILNGSTCDAYLSNYDKGQEEVTIPSSITYEGKTYKVDFFYWSLYDMGDWTQAISRDIKVKKGSPKDVLKKITIEKGVWISSVEVADHFKNLEEVVFEDPEEMGSAIFYDCPKLKKFYISKDATSCPTLIECPNTRLIIDSENPYFKMIGKDLYTKDGKTLCSVGSTKAHYKVKKGVTGIANYAFYGNDHIKTIYIPDSVKKIGVGAFGYMKNLKSVRLSRFLKSIPLGLFEESKKLKTITFPASVKKFYGDFGGKRKCKLKKIYINTRNLKKSYFNSIPKTCKIYVKNKKVQKQVKKYGFKGKVIIKK